MKPDAHPSHAPHNSGDVPLLPGSAMVDGAIRVAPIMAIPGLLTERGIDAAALLREFGVEPGFLDDPENVITFASLGRLLRLCVERTGCAHFGLLVGQRAGPSALGPIGFLMQSAPNARTALEKLQSDFHVHDRGGSVHVAVEGRFVTLGYTLHQRDMESGDQILDAAIAIGFGVLRALCGPDWRPTRIWLAHRKPADVQPFRRFFGPAPIFDAETSGIMFASHWLDRRPPGADVVLYRLMESRVRALADTVRTDEPGRVRGMLRQALVSRDYTFSTIAARLGLSERTLTRRLWLAGTTFRQLRDEVRFDAACHLIAHTDLKAIEIAHALGYADAAAFTRAFERWSGTSPDRWRKLRNRSRDAATRPERRAGGA